MCFVPEGFYALEKAVLNIARELDNGLWDHTKMPLAEINAYEWLGEKTHFQDLEKIILKIELSLPDRKTGKFPKKNVAERFKAYKDAQKLVRGALNAGELRSFRQIEKTGQRLQQVAAEAGAKDNAMNWFDDGRMFIAPDDGNFVDAQRA